jgi:hypothetical protein
MRSVEYNLYVGVCTVQYSSQSSLYLHHVISLKRTVIEAQAGRVTGSFRGTHMSLILTINCWLLHLIWLDLIG